MGLGSAGLPAIVGVIGGGRMGAGIAHAFACSGARVVLVEADEDAASAACRTVAKLISATAARGLLGEEASDVRDRVAVAVGLTELAPASLVVEAVPEDMVLKARLLGELESIVEAHTTISTNTSALAIDELAAGLRHPGRFLGLHFFNPVPASLLVEVVMGSATSSEVVDRVQAWVRVLGKTPVLVRDSPGFATSRLGVALALEAIRMLEDGVAAADDIDSAMVLGYKHPLGPLRLTDIIGLDVRLSIAQYLATRLGPRFDPPNLLRTKVSRGELGRKAGQGFYLWESPPGRRGEPFTSLDGGDWVPDSHS